MLNCLAVGLGGCLGSVLRYLLSLVPLGLSLAAVFLAESL